MAIFIKNVIKHYFISFTHLVQVIYAGDIDSSISTFGWSLSAGMDLDENEYPDLLIGAYESASAVYLKSAPVVHLDSKVQWDPD